MSSAAIAQPAATPATRPLLKTLFLLLNGGRIAAYLPTIYAIAASGASNQHSLWTWLVFCGANFSMAAWVASRRDCAFWVSIGNGCMCAAVATAIVACRA